MFQSGFAGFATRAFNLRSVSSFSHPAGPKPMNCFLPPFACTSVLARSLKLLALQVVVAALAVTCWAQAGTGRIRRRTMTSEMLFLQLSRLDIWVAVRNVLTVDGQAVPEKIGRAHV